VIEVTLPGATAVFSTRVGGVSEGPYDSLNLGILTDDEPARVQQNRALVADRLGLDPARVVMGWQVHGTELREWSAAPEPGHDGFATPGAEMAKVDGHVTGAAGLAMLVLAADCLPVALASPSRAAMLHCGWRGLAGGILERALERFGDDTPGAAVGPGIGRCCYEVGPEVLGAFSDLDGVATGRMLDLRAVAEARLRAAGVERVEHVDLCTSCREDLFFSHRRDGGITGRQAGLVWRKA
jgi:YfiH family protein